MDKKKLALFIFGAVLMLGATNAMADPCDADVEQYCSSVQPGNGSIASCLQSYSENISFQCRERLQKIDQATQRKINACSSDAREYCRDVKPGYGRIKGCLMSNLDKVSTDCRTVLQGN